MKIAPQCRRCLQTTYSKSCVRRKHTHTYTDLANIKQKIITTFTLIQTKLYFLEFDARHGRKSL